MRKRIRGTSRELDQAARELRREPTPAEARLWEALRRDQFLGLRFRRQHPVGRFVLDFYCARHKLCIEVDGAYHERQPERDAERTAVLAAAGYTVLRFTNEEVISDLDLVLRRIEANLPPPPYL
ncbi:MAG TPA: endonuclease domain-containing protein [Longimicrobiaceae bacterium]|nr:endonuclease domain-containing protein [Longimicrobiaceae bacterium]